MTSMLFRPLIILIAIAAIGSGAALAADAPKKGGVLKIGNLGEPPSLDPHWGTQTITEVLANHVFEGLYARVALVSDQNSKYDLTELARTRGRVAS